MRFNTFSKSIEALDNSTEVRGASEAREGENREGERKDAERDCCQEEHGCCKEADSRGTAR